MARYYSQEFKQDALQYKKDHPELDNHQIADYLGVPYGTLYGWIKLERKRENPDAYDESGRQTDEEKPSRCTDRAFRPF